MGYKIFYFGFVVTQSTEVCFQDYFSWKIVMDVVYLAKNITKTTQHWKRSGRPIIKLVAFSTFFELYLKENMVVVNVNKGVFSPTFDL